MKGNHLLFVLLFLLSYTGEVTRESVDYEASKPLHTKIVWSMHTKYTWVSIKTSQLIVKSGPEI